MHIQTLSIIQNRSAICRDRGTRVKWPTTRAARALGITPGHISGGGREQAHRRPPQCRTFLQLHLQVLDKIRKAKRFKLRSVHSSEVSPFLGLAALSLLVVSPPFPSTFPVSRSQIFVQVISAAYLSSSHCSSLPSSTFTCASLPVCGCRHGELKPAGESASWLFVIY
jgi:hypothetical protein